MTYLINYTGVVENPVVTRHTDTAGAVSYAETLPQDHSAVIINTEDGFAQMKSIAMLAKLYNTWVPEKPVSKFENKDTACSRLWRVLTTKFVNLPVTEVVPASKEPKMSEAKEKAPKAPKASKEAKTPKVGKIHESQPAGPAKPVRQGSSLATLLALMDGSRTFEQIASESGIEPGVLGTLSKTKHRIQFVMKMSHGITHTVDGQGRITAVLPKGFTAESIVAKPKEKTATAPESIAA